MEFEEQDEHDEEELDLPAPTTYDSPHPKMPPHPSSAAGLEAPPSSRKPRYRECQKNHAVGLGGHAVDGCGEFLPAGPDGTIESLKCAACGCHRNFHRKETDTTNTTAEAFNNFSSHHHHHHHPPPHPFLLPQHPHQNFSPYYRTPSGYLHVAAARPLALPSTSGGGGGGSREDQEDMSNPNTTSTGGGGGSSGKRHRTKFTAEQKEKMLELAEKLGWRIQKHDEEAIQQFCNESGVKRHVLKVWMHNNKHTLGKKP